jgi:hydrogenase maturation protease
LQTTLILGIGNTLLGDEGAGVHAARRVAVLARGRPDVALLDGGTLGFSLLPAIEDYGRLIVLDAARVGGAPGTVKCFESAAMDEFLGKPRRSVHEVGLCDLLDMARLAGRMPACRALIGIEPEFVDWSDSPSNAVATALDGAATLALELVDRWHAECAA